MMKNHNFETEKIDQNGLGMHRIRWTLEDPSN